MSDTTRPSTVQSQDLIYALDIGTRSVIGLLAKTVEDKVQVLAMEKLLHTHRAMIDGQIEDIAQVAAAVHTVTDRLEHSNFSYEPDHTDSAASIPAMSTSADENRFSKY